MQLFLTNLVVLQWPNYNIIDKSTIEYAFISVSCTANLNLVGSHQLTIVLISVKW